jgi:hypothetical protein
MAIKLRAIQNRFLQKHVPVRCVDFGAIEQSRSDERSHPTPQGLKYIGFTMNLVMNASGETCHLNRIANQVAVVWRVPMVASVRQNRL